jgi:hypothetical protein
MGAKFNLTKNIRKCDRIKTLMLSRQCCCFTEKGGELTPILKLKRFVTVTRKYADVIDAILYA